MGELIRNLHEITMGDETLMVELNEGYRKSQGQVIHIQNNKFRLLLTAKNYLRLATTVLRARSEMEYYKAAKAAEYESVSVPVHEEADDHTKAVILKWHQILTEAGVSYRLIESGKNYATIIIDPAAYKTFRKKVRSISGIKEAAHIYGKKYGYSFLYQMRPLECYVMDGVCLEICCQLPCLSLTPKTWVPIDKCVQQRVFAYSQTDSDGVYQLDDVSSYIYRLCHAVFCNHGFGAYDKAFFGQRKAVLSDEAFSAALVKVFFGYAEKMTQMLSDERYDEIVSDYYKFREY